MGCLRKSFSQSKKIAKVMGFCAAYLAALAVMSLAAYTATMPSTAGLESLFPKGFEEMTPQKFITGIVGKSAAEGINTQETLAKIEPLNEQIKNVIITSIAATSLLLLANIFVMAFFKEKIWSTINNIGQHAGQYLQFARLTALETIIFVAFTISMFFIRPELVMVVFPAGLFLFIFADMILYSGYRKDAKTALLQSFKTLRKIRRLIAPMILIAVIYNLLLAASTLLIVITPYLAIAGGVFTILFTLSWPKIYLNEIIHDKNTNQ